MQRRRLVRVPASSANLGPGFDVLAAALQLHLEVEVEETGQFEVVTDLDIARDRRNLCVRAFAALHPPDDFRFTINSDIPLSGGLGSSAESHWATIYASVADVEQTLGKAESLGGSRIYGPMAVDDHMQTGAFRDPAGATLRRR